MRKPLSLILIGALLLLSACNNSKSTEASSTASPAPTTGPAAAVKPAEKKTLEFWHTYTGEKEIIFNEAIARFEQKHPDVEVKAVQAATDAYKQKFAVAMSAGSPPDGFGPERQNRYKCV
jgi:raffinose/stachyose/melibiose transport system substrate-binding protein